MVDGKLLQRIVVWPTYEDALTAEQEAASSECKRTNKLTVWDTYEEAAAHVSAGSGGGGNAYVASAVTFDSSTLLRHDTALAANSPVGTLSLWHNIPSDAFNNQRFLMSGNVFAFFPDSGDMYCQDEGGSNWAQFTFPSNLKDGQWHHRIFSWNTNFGAGEKIFQYYVDDVLTAVEVLEAGEAFSIFLQDTFWAFANGAPQNNDFADVAFYPGTFIDLSNVTNRRKFIDASGKPVDPSFFPANPTVLFSGDAATFGTNQGTGGAFTLTGSLTNASTSPSD